MVGIDALRLGAGLGAPARRRGETGRLPDDDRQARSRSAGTSRTRSSLGPDGRLYLGSGSTCDACREKDRRSGAILSFKPDGSDLEIVATGLRNPFGLVFDGDTLYVSDNARDDLGETEPAETIVRIKPGADYGWPRCWASWQRSKAAGLVPRGDAAGGVPRAALVGELARFWRGTLIVAEWGQYLSERWGRKLVQVNVRNRPLVDVRRRLRAPARPRGRAAQQMKPGPPRRATGAAA